MAVLTETTPRIIIAGLSMDDYSVMDVALHKELLKPAELVFTMRKKSLLRNDGDICFEVAEQLIGSSVKLEIKTRRQDQGLEQKNETLAFSGIVFNAKMGRQRVGHAAYITVTAYSPDYLLVDNQHCCSFEQLTLQEIILESVAPYDGTLQTSLSPSMGESIPYVVQYNETTYQFISRLAQRYGEFLYYENGRMCFGQLPQEQAKELYPDVDVLGFQYMLNMEHTNFRHAEHNYLKYENIDAHGAVHAGEELNPLADMTFDRAQSSYKKETLQHYHAATQEDSSFDQVELSSTIQAWNDKSRYLTCTLRTNRADLVMGDRIVLKEYMDEDTPPSIVEHEPLVVIGVDYHATADGHFENEVTAIPADVPYAPYLADDLYPVCESQRARVVDNKDPEQLGRIRVQFLWQELTTPNRYSPWLRIAQPHGGDDKGFYFIPEIGEEVMVAFENGNAEKPYVVGTLFHGKQHPGYQWPDNNNNVKAIRTRNGHTVEIHDEGPGGYIRIYDYKKENYILTYSTDEKLIKLESTGNIELYAANDIIMHAGHDMKIKVGHDRTLEVGNDQDVQVGNDQTIAIGHNNTMQIGADQTIDIDGNKDERVANMSFISAKDYREEIENEIVVLSKTQQYKASNSTKIDGGTRIDIKATIAKIN